MEHYETNRSDLRDISIRYDIPRWLSLVIVLATSASVPLSLVYYSSNYLTSAFGLADGGDMYSHFTEAMHLKEQLQRGTTDVWYDSITLGYPVFLAYQPLPCCVSAAFMALMERYISPFQAFRWLFFLVLTAMPLSWYHGTQQIGMTRLQSSLVTLCLFSLHSWVDFGLELSAFRKYGLYTQAYGMLMLPIAVGFSYQYILYGKGSRDATAMVIALNLLSHSIFGIHLVLLTGTMIASFLFVHMFFNRSALNVTSMCARAVYVHGTSLVYCSWWMLPTLLCYKFIGGLPWKYDLTNAHNISIVIRTLLSGEMYDFGRSFPYITLGILAGLSCVFFSGHYASENSNDSVKTKLSITVRHQTVKTWLGFSFFVFLTLFLGRGTFGAWYDLIPFHGEMESLRYLNGLHFIGLLLFAVGTSCVLIHMCRFMTKITGYTVDKLLVISIVFCAPMYLTSQLETINSNLTVTEINDGLQNALRQLKQFPVSGRLYGNKQFGTDGPWELTFLPYITRKPGIQTYSRGYHDTLSVFYIESFQPDLSTTPWFPDLMRLFNIRYIFANKQKITTEFLHQCNLLKLMIVDNDTQIFIRSADQVYGYFEFVFVPGMVRGNLKDIRAAVRSTTQIYQVNSVLAINPFNIELLPQAKVEVTSNNPQLHQGWFFSLPYWLINLLSPNEIGVAKWTFDGHNVSEDVFLESVMKLYIWQPIRSKVLKEITKTNEYSAIVEIAQESFSKDFYSTEHLLLKVTYHPYWSCRYAKPAALTYQENQPKRTDQEFEKWQDVDVHHVTPNLMSITLPPGRHEVFCSYSNPLYQKIALVIFLFTVTMILIKELLTKASKMIQAQA